MITSQDITAIVAEVFGVALPDLYSKARTQRYTHPRMAAYCLIREHTDNSLPKIGRQFGRDHTSVLHGIRRVGELLAQIGTDFHRLYRECQRRVLECLSEARKPPSEAQQMALWFTTAYSRLAPVYGVNIDHDPFEPEVAAAVFSEFFKKTENLTNA